MKHRCIATSVMLVGVFLVTASPAVAATPVNPSASPEAPLVLNYLHERFGKEILAAQHGAQREYDYVQQMTGKYAATRGTDLTFSGRNDRLMNEVIGWRHVVVVHGVGFIHPKGGPGSSQEGL